MAIETLDPAIEMLRGRIGEALARWHSRRRGDRSVRVRRLSSRGHWLFTISLGRLKPSSPRFDFSVEGSQRLEIAGSCLDLASADPPLEIVRTNFGAGKLLLHIAAAGRSLADAYEAERDASRVLGEAARRLQALSEPVRQVAAARAMRGLEHILEQAPVATVGEAAASTSDVAVILRILEAPDALDPLKLEDPLVLARMRGVHERERLLAAEGGTWSADEVAKHLGLTRQGVNKRRQQGTLLALDAGRHGYRYPVWQFVREGVLEGLARGLRALGRFDSWTQHAFMVSKNVRLSGRTPVEALERRDVEAVVRAADAYGEHGAA